VLLYYALVNITVKIFSEPLLLHGIDPSA